MNTNHQVYTIPILSACNPKRTHQKRYLFSRKASFPQGRMDEPSRFEEPVYNSAYSFRGQE